jgi:hypothetical protein
MTIERKLLSTSPSGGATDVDEVFSTDLYRGNGGTQQNIDNGIDLVGEGGMVWIKPRNVNSNHVIFDTERWSSSNGKGLFPNNTNAEGNINELKAFNSNGFRVGDTGYINDTNKEMVAWTFRKKEKFFDIVTVNTGNSTNTRHSHNLGSRPHFIIGKSLNGTAPWYSYSEAIGKDKHVRLNGTNAATTTSNIWGSGDPTDTDFGVNDAGSGFGNYGAMVYYLFADNSAEDADDQMIKCDKYTGSGSDVSINLGWEPQWLLIKNTTSTSNWFMCDYQRGMPAFGDMSNLVANTADTEGAVEGFNNHVQTSATGFTVSAGKTATNTNNHVYIYIAIRAPMMKKPSTATEVFALSSRATTAANTANVRYYSGFPVDMYIRRNNRDQTQDNYIVDRKHHNKTDGTSGGTRYFYTNSATNYNNSSDWLGTNVGIEPHLSDESNNAQAISKMWKRAKGFFDVVSYRGTGSVTTIPHSLGVVPEMMWIKTSSSGSGGWQVYTAEGAGTKYLHLEDNYTYSTSSSRFNNTAATSSVFTVGVSGRTNDASSTHVAYLFATLAGISKCGNYTGNGSYQTIPCGFSAGSRSVLIKRTDVEGDWYVWDSLVGIVSGNDPHMSLNTNAAEVTNDDSIDPANSGFIVNQVSATNINVSSAKYIFYAIA